VKAARERRPFSPVRKTGEKGTHAPICGGAPRVRVLELEAYYPKQNLLQDCWDKSQKSPKIPKNIAQNHPKSREIYATKIGAKTETETLANSDW
jgi:hypothetical protein